ncbi:MAG: hypothetical protein WCJ18_05705 [Planctomycetota bacterium]
MLANGHIAFTVGPWVERTKGGIYEGVWAGTFSTPERALSTHAFGSGALINEQRVTILLPKGNWEAVFLLRDKTRGRTHIANSLCHCLASAEIEVGSPFFSGLLPVIFDRTNAQTRVGAYRYDPLIHEDDRMALYGLYYNDFDLKADGSLSFLPAQLGRDFSDYDQYRAFLVDTITAIAGNATDPARRQALSPKVPVSQGYDSPAVAVLAREAGCNEAISCDVVVGGETDSGVEIAEKLGYRTESYPHPLGPILATLNVDFPPNVRQLALEFIATQGLGDDIVFASMEPALTGATLLTGSLGDSIWDRRATLPPGLPVRIIYGKSITEFRLRVGYAHVPVPAIGAFFPRSIARLSAAPEMRPYSVGGRYNRPIPRRIVEEAGIARGAFGRRKNAVNPHPFNRNKWCMEAFSSTLKRYQI